MNPSLLRRRTIACAAAVIAVAGVTMLGVTPAAQATTAPPVTGASGTQTD
jgi:hypothetical protein